MRTPSILLLSLLSFNAAAMPLSKGLLEASKKAIRVDAERKVAELRSEQQRIRTNTVLLTKLASKQGRSRSLANVLRGGDHVELAMDIHLTSSGYENQRGERLKIEEVARILSARNADVNMKAVGSQVAALRNRTQIAAKTAELVASETYMKALRISNRMVFLPNDLILDGSGVTTNSGLRLSTAEAVRRIRNTALYLLEDKTAKSIEQAAQEAISHE
jgi:hypothetical protein